MAEENSKKYLSSEGLKYTLQQLKGKIDELYVSEQEIFKTVQSERSFSGSEIQGQYNLFEGALNLVPGQTYTLVCDGIEYPGTCSSNGTLKFKPASGAWNITFWDKHGLEEYGPDEYDVIKTGGDTFVITNMAGKTEFVLKGGEVKVIDSDLLPDTIATKKYVDNEILPINNSVEYIKEMTDVSQFNVVNGILSNITTFATNKANGDSSTKRYINANVNITKAVYKTNVMFVIKNNQGQYCNNFSFNVLPHSDLYNVDNQRCLWTINSVECCNGAKIQVKIYSGKQFDSNFALIDSAEGYCCIEITIASSATTEQITMLDTATFIIDIIDYNYLALDGELEYTPTRDYHPATKKYVDENKFSGDYNDLTNKPVSIINFNTDFVDAVATYDEAYKVDAIAFNQPITVDDSYEYFAEAKYTDGTVVTKPLELAETSYRMYSRINAKAVVGSFDGNVIDTNNQIGYVTSLIPIKYYNNKIRICKRYNASWYDFDLLVVDENLTITNIYTHDNLPTVDSLPSTAAYFAIYNYYTSSITDVDYLFSGDATDGGLYIRIASDTEYAGVCIFLERSEEGNSILSNTEYTICKATSNYVLRNSDFGLYIADSMDVIYPAAGSETFVANDTGFASAMLIMNYKNISSIRVYTKNILVNTENKELATKEYVDDAIAANVPVLDEDELDTMFAEIFGEYALRGSVSIINNTWSGNEPIESMTNNNIYIEYGKPYTNTIKFTASYYFIQYRFTNGTEEYSLYQNSNNEISIEIAQIDQDLGDLIIEILEYS